MLGFLAAALALAATPSAAQVGPAAEYRNPVHDVDFADPFVLSTPTGWYAYATHRGLANIQIAHSTDLVTWRDVGTALPVLPLWATGPLVWAPSVLATADGHVLYYAVRDRATGRFCVSAATSTLPSGPFLDRSSAPLVCQHERGGTIDPSPFVDDDGRAYLLFKSEGVPGTEPTRLWAQPLRADGLALEGVAAELLSTALPWEAPIVENPAMTRGPGGRYHLLYSGGRWSSADYAVGWAACDTPLGPCHRGDDEPLLRASPDVLGPGGADFFAGPDDTRWISYHGWVGAAGYPEGRRALLIGRVAFVDGRPWVDAPALGPVRFDDVPGPEPVPPPAVVPAAAVPPAPTPASAVETPAIEVPVAEVAAAPVTAPERGDPAQVARSRPVQPDRRDRVRPSETPSGRSVVEISDDRDGAVVAWLALAAAVGAALVTWRRRAGRSALVDAEADLDLDLPTIDLTVVAEVGAEVGDLAPRLPVHLGR